MINKVIFALDHKKTDNQLNMFLRPSTEAGNTFFHIGEREFSVLAAFL